MMTFTDVTKGTRGVQQGGSATTAESRRLDQQLKTTALRLCDQYLGYSRGHNRRQPLFEGVQSGCEPDGGLWLDDQGLVRVAIEAKVQGDHGNAQERHAKNLMICETFRGRNFRYVTFMAGLGARPGGVLDLYAQTVLRCRNPEGSRQTNRIYDQGVSFLLSPGGWRDQDIEALMREALR